MIGMLCPNKEVDSYTPHRVGTIFDTYRVYIHAIVAREIPKSKQETPERTFHHTFSGEVSLESY